MTDKDLYTTLGVKRTASYDEIRVAYRQLAQVLHPDRQAHRPEREVQLAERRIREINEAWTILSNTTRRQEYDYELERLERHERVRRAVESDPNSSNAPKCSPRQGHARPGPVGPEPKFQPGREYRFDGVPISSDDTSGHYDYLEEDVSPAQMFILRRTPWLVVFVILFIIFVMTAYARNDAEAPAELPRHECVRILDGRVATLVSCDIENDGRVVAEVTQPLDCPDGSRYVMVNERMLCATAT